MNIQNKRIIVKNLFAVFLFSSVIIFCNNKNIINLNKPNKPCIHNPLPFEALKYTFENYSDDFSKKLSPEDAQSFHKFLIEREKMAKSDKESSLKNEAILIENLMINYHISREKLPPHILAMCAFADSLNKLIYHQEIVEIGAYPKETSLTPFEENYSFKLSPVPHDIYAGLTSLILPTKINLIFKATTKRWANFLLTRGLRK